MCAEQLSEGPTAHLLLEMMIKIMTAKEGYPPEEMQEIRNSSRGRSDGKMENSTKC